MSAIVSELFGAVSSFASNFFTVIPGGVLDSGGVITPISIQATLEETMADLVTVTEHPVEAGANITDHAYYRPAELTMRCGWSNASALQSAVSSLFSSGGDSSSSSSSDGMSVSDYVSGVYSQLLALQQSLQPFSVVTSIRLYNNMILTELNISRDQKTSQALMATATMRQVILVSTTSSTTLAPVANQAIPSSTAEQVPLGQQNASAGATPAPGGSFPSTDWPGEI